MHASVPVSVDLGSELQIGLARIRMQLACF